MHRTDAPGATDSNRFTDGDASLGIPASVVGEDWLNAVQEEPINVIAAAGIALDKADNTQLLQAIRKLIADTAAQTKRQLYPVGSSYTNADDGTNPATLLGFGTWQRFAAGRVMVGLDTGDFYFNYAGRTGGEKFHRLTEFEMPRHSHGYLTNYGGGFDSGNSSGQGGDEYTEQTGTAGGGGAHNNLQPYVVVHMWRRTA